MKTDLEIARATKLRPIIQIAESIGLTEDAIELYGQFKAKVDVGRLPTPHPDPKLVLVTAITPNKAGVGKTMTSVALALGLNRIGKRAIAALREPSLGPCFGMKGGATGGGRSQVLPMEDINLHFTGDFHAITCANNMLAALVDNYSFFNRGSGKALRQIVWRRVLDINDRSLRHIITGLHAPTHGVPTETGFDITPASEIMAILCLARDTEDLRARLDNILVGYSFDGDPVFVRDLKISGALVTLLKDALKPNLVQTTEHTPAIIHGGPFANIAQGCNSIVATRAALSLGEYVVTEAGFGSDLGAEKFFNIKCRAANLSPRLSVLVITTQALKLHGGVPASDIRLPNIAGLREGLRNAERHLRGLQSFGQTVLCSLNRFSFDTDEEIAVVREWCESKNLPFSLNDGHALGGEGAREMAEHVVALAEKRPSPALRFSYELNDSVPEKLNKVVRSVYGGRGATLTAHAGAALARIEKLGLSHLPICIAKTQYSFSDDPTRLGVADDFDITVQDLVVNSGAGFIVAIAGDIMRMPGLPKQPQALSIDFVDGEFVGLM